MNAAIDTLVLANGYSDRLRFEWKTISKDGLPVRATNGLVIVPDTRISERHEYDMIFVCGGHEANRQNDPDVSQWLRRQAHSCDIMGGLTSGAYTLAFAGLLDGYRCTVHWKYCADFSEEFDAVTLDPKLYVIDRNRFTTAGGIVSIDLFLQIVAQYCDHDVFESVANSFHLHRIRDEEEGQYSALPLRNTPRSDRMMRVIALMERNLGEPLSLARLSEHVSMSEDQLRRMFRDYADDCPAQYYQGLRLNSARRLVTTTQNSLIDIALQTGFSSISTFIRAYRNKFGTTPGRDRKKKLARLNS